LKLNYLLIIGIITPIFFGVDNAFAASVSIPQGTSVPGWMEGLIIFQGGSSETSTITLSIDKDRYYQGEKIQVSGWVSNTSLGESITLLVLNPDNEISVLESIKPSFDGSYQKNIIVTGPNWKKEGWYSIETTFGSLKNNEKFYIFSGHISEFPPPTKLKVDVVVAQGTSVPGCESTNSCYIPYSYSTTVGSTVTWRNNDLASHTVTSRSTADGPSGKFDSGILTTGTFYSHVFTEIGVFHYFCVVHPWMEGIVKVQAVGSSPTPTVVMDLKEIMAEIQTSDGLANEAMTIDLTLTDLDGNGIEHITYNIKATQGSDVVLDEEGHMHQGTLTNSHMTSPLPSDASDSMPVVIAVESIGFGHDELYVDVPGEIATKQVVPEFGTISIIILAFAIIFIIGLSAKSKLSIIPKV